MAKNSNINLIKQKWKILQNEPGIFKYSLNLIDSKFLEGKLKLYCELNPDRSKLRRTPQTISSLNPTFSYDKFNFNKITSQEILLDVPYEDTVVTFIINQSPLTNYHSLICPDLVKSYPQKLTKPALDFSIHFLLSLDEKEFRIGYNSPGALASVNHLHLHLLYIDRELYIDKAVSCTTNKDMIMLDTSQELEPIGKDVYRLHHTMPTEAICYIVNKDNEQSISQSIFKLIEFFCTENIPHNIFITPDRTKAVKTLKLFVYAREQHCIIKDLCSFNVAFCEFSGYIPIGDPKLFNELSEEIVLKKIKEANGNAYTSIYNYLSEL